MTMLKPIHPNGSATVASETSNLGAENERLRLEIEKLNKINQVLMRRVELGWGNHSDAYQSFENAALLSDKLREGTQKLKQTMGKLEKANQEVSRAQQESEQARQLLVDSVESIFDAFALFDHHHQMVLANSRFYELWSHTDLTFEMGKTLLSDLVRYSLENGIFKPEAEHPMVRTIPLHSFGNGIYQLRDDRWVQTSERSTAEGGLVLTFTDITLLKNSETRQRELALEQQARILEATINNMSQGVALIDANCRLLAWNTRFLEISRLSNDEVEAGVDFHQLIRSCELYLGTELPPMNVQRKQGWTMQEHEKVLRDGTVVLIRRHLVPGGGFVNTYTDITERSHQQAALRESEKRIRLITDAVPALISYIDRELCYQFANLQFETWYQTGREQIVGRSLREVLGDKAYLQHENYLRLALEGESVEFEVEESSPGKPSRITQKTYVPHFDSDNQVLGFFALEQDVTRQRRTKLALKAAYDNLEERVYQRTKQISEINDKLRDEIRERRQVEANLLNAKREAEEANLSKIKFLAATSHDLLQPLNAACLFASTLEERSLPEDTQHLVESLGYSLRNIESLISALVDISKLDAGVVEPEMDSFNADDLLRNLANEFHQQNEGHETEFHYVASTVMVHSDSQLLARILRNFLTNAFRYTNKGRIVLGARRRKHGLEVQVLDTGAGISEHDQKKIFEEFHRGQNHASREDRGLGLGLAIVDKVSRILEHPVSLSSKPGKGSCFSVLMPYGVEALPDSDRQADATQTTSALPRKNHHVLVIDNDESICQGMQLLLRGWGCKVKTAQTNQQINELIENGFDVVPDLVIADYHLDDDLTGLEVALKINEKQLQQIPVILITADYTSELRQRVRELGYHLMNKPVKPIKLKLAMNHLLQGRYNTVEGVAN